MAKAIVPATYQHRITSRALPQQEDGNIFYDSNVLPVLEFVGLPKRYAEDITAAYVLSGDGDYDGVWLSEDSAPWEDGAIFHPLSYYRAGFKAQKKAEIYWLETNELYQKGA